MNVKRLINYQKLISVITATCLLVSFVIGPTAASAINNEQTTEEYKQIFKEFILPYSYGKITNAHYAGTDRVIINIQDLHCHPKVQKNIANIIETFDKKFGVQKIYLEGAYGDVSTKWIADKTNNNKNVIEQMLDTGRLTGAEYYSALSGKTDLIKGLEEKEPYLDNIKRLGKILQDQGNIDLILKSLHDCTDKIKKKYYTKRQYKLENLFNKYKEGKIPSQKYYTLLSKHIDKLGIDLTKYENSLIYLTLLELQKDLNYKQITRELQELVSVLKQQLPYNAYKSLLENTENFKEVEKLYSYIVQLDKTCNLNISSNFKELDKYFRYVELSKKINPVELVKEDEFLIQEINTRFAQTKAQQDVVFLTYFEKYLKDYLTTKITLDDYKYYQENINRYIQVYNKYVDNRVLSLLNEYIEETDKFYNINLDRNTYFTKNIFVENEFLNQIENTSSAQDDINKIIDNMQQVKELDIVVTGGFHSQTVTELLKNQNVSYIVITPNVTDGIKLAEDTYYELAKEQSKIAFQTIAPVIASLSPKLQATLLEKIGNVNQEEISKIVSLDEDERTKVISEVIAANLLESDDIGAVEEKLQEIVEDIVEEDVSYEVLSKIKNLQKLLKNKEKLQKVIYSLNKSQAKQAGILVSDIFAKLYDAFASFVSSINEIFSKQEKEPTDFYDDENFDNDIDKEEDMDSMGEEEIYDDDLDLWFSDVDIINLSREIIKVGQNNKDIKDFIWYLGKYNMADYELLNKILDELKTLNDDSKRIQEYCGIIYALTDKNTINAKEKAAKTKENIMSFFEKPKSVQLKFCDLFSKLFVGHDYMKDNFFNALLDFVNKNEYTDTDFDFLLKVCKYSNLISELGTKENIYNFLILDIEKRKLLYAFYQAPKSHTNININRLTLNFILSVLNKYDFIGEQFDYIMNLICSVNITNDSVDQKYVESLKEKEINMSVLENFKYIDIYNRYLLDLLFSDVDELNVEVFVSEMQTMVNLFDDLQYYKIDTLETENKGFALAIFFNDGFEKYCRDNNIIDLVKQYQLAIRVSRKIYSILGDNIFTTPIDKMDEIIKETLDYYNKIDKIIAFLNLFTNKTAIFSLHNNERNFDRKTFRFTPAGIKEILKRLEIEPEVFETIEISFMDKVLDFIKTIKQDEIDKQLLIDFVNNLDGSVIIKKDILEYLSKKKDNTISKKTINRYINRLKITERFVEVNHFLSYIEHFNDYGQEKGVFIFDGHGSDDGIFYTDNSKLTVNQISQALIKAHNNGVNLENLTLMFSSCHSYKFADNIINELINNGITTFPQIITDAGKETVYGYTTTVKLEGERTKVSNVFYSLMKYLDSQTSEQLQQMKGRLTFKDLADAPRYLSNNTVFVTNQQVSELNRELERNIRNIIEGNDTEEAKDKNYSGNEDNMYISSYNLYAQLQLPFTQKVLNKIGNLGIIKSIYKERAGKNFKNTKFGVAIGILLETFAFWLPNFVSKHEFDPSQESGVRAVVWKIRALSIGIGIIPAILSLLNPISAAFILPAILLTENILHYIYDIRNSKISVKFNNQEQHIAILIEKDDDRYSLMFKPKEGSIYVNSINGKAFSKDASKYNNIDSIEDLLGVKIKISKHRLSIKSKDIRTNIKAIKYSELFEKTKSLILQDLPSPEQKEIDLIKNNAKCSGVEYIYLDNRDIDNRKKIQQSVKNNKLLILYPFSKTCDIDKLTDEELFSLYLQISTNFVNMLREVLPSYPKLKENDFYGMEYLLNELIKNAFVHGNLADPSKPIYIHCGQNGFTVYNAYNKNQSTSAKRLSFAAMSALSGESEGNKIISGYEKENLITVNRKIGRIDDNFDDEFYVVTIEKTEPKAIQVKKDVKSYLDFNNFKIREDSFKYALEVISQANKDYEITEKTYEYVQYLLYFLHTKNDWLESYHHDIIRQIFGLGDEYVEILVDYFKKNEGWLKGNIDIIRRIMDFAVKQGCTKEEFKELLAFVADIKDVYSADDMVYMRYGYLRKNIRENPISAQFFKYYLQNKSFFESSERHKFLMAHLIFSGDQNIEQCLTNENFDSHLKMLFDNLSKRNIRFLNVSEYGLAIKIFFNSVFNKELELQYEKNNQTLTPLIRYRIALKIANNLCEQLGNKARLINQDIINRIVSVCIQDINDKRELLKNRYFIEKNSDFHGNDGIHIDFTEGENADFVVDRGHVSNMGVFSVNNNQTDVKGNRIFSSDGILFLFKSLYTKPRVYMDLNVEGYNDVEEKINKQLKAITEYNSIKEKYGLSGSIFAFNGHGADKTICFIGKDGSAKALLTVSDLAKALLQSYKNGANLEEITLDLSSCFSYNFAKNLIKELKELEEKEGLQIKYPQILSSAGQETELSTSFSYKNNNTGQFAMYIDNMASAILENLQQINRNGESPDSLSFDFIFNSEIDTSNHTIFISGQDVANVNANFRQKLFEILGEDFIKEGEVKKTIQTAQMQLPFTQKVLNKIGNIGIIKSIYKEKAGENFRFTKLGVAIGVLFETILFWMPNFVKAHNFDPSIQTKMTAVVWVIRALSIGIGFGIGSIWALLLTETIIHFIWNISVISIGRNDLLLQTSKNVAKEQKIQKIFEVSKMETDFEEDDEEKQEINSLLNKEEISEADIDFVLQKANFFANDSLYNYYKLKFFFSVIGVLREKNVDINNGIYEQVMLLMTVFTYEQAALIPGEEPYKIVNQLDEGDTEEKVLRFFNLKSENRQQIYNKLNGVETLGAFELMLKSVEECEQAGCTEQEIDELLSLINNSRKVMEEYYFRDFEKGFLSVRNLRFYIDQKNKLISRRNFINFFTIENTAKSPLWLSLIYSTVNINSVVGNNNTKIDRLIELIEKLEEAKIRMLDTGYNGLTLRIFLNEEFRNRLKELEGKNEEPTIFDMYRTAQKISRTLYEVMGDNVFMLSEQDLNAVMETMTADNLARRSVAKNIEIVSENTGTIAIHNIELDKHGSRRFSIRGIEKIMSLLRITPKLVTDFVITDKSDVRNKVDNWLSSIENFLDILEQNGLTNIRYVFDGHGSSNGLHLTTATSDDLSVKKVAETLFAAYKKCVEQGKGEKFENLILDLSSCSSYEFARKVLGELKQMEEKAGLPLRFPQIVTEAGKETEIGYSVTYSAERFLVSNMEASLIVYIRKALSEGRSISSITLQDLFDAQIFMSNHTIFVSNSEIEKLNEKLRQDLTKILRKGLVPEKDAEVYRDQEPLPVRVSELQLPFTQKVLNKIGNIGIIKSIYKEKAGENFRFTKLGVAIGVLFETILFWMPNFVKAHNFDPSIQTKMTAVVWVIRALSIGIGFGIGSIWALLLTETTIHFIWNISVISIGRNDLLLQTPKQSLNGYTDKEVEKNVSDMQESSEQVKQDTSNEQEKISTNTGQKTGKNKHSIKSIVIRLLAIVLTSFMLMLGGYGISSSVGDTDVISIPQITDIFNDTLESKEDYQKLIDELGVDGINQLLNSVKNENEREEKRSQFAHYIKDSQYVELLSQSVKDGNYKEFFEIFDPAYNKLIKGNLGNMRAGAKEYEALMENLGIEGISKIIESIDDEQIKTTVVKDIVKSKYNYFLADAVSKGELDLFFDTFDSDYSYILSMSDTDVNCLLLNYFRGFNDLEVFLDYFDKDNKSEITNTLINKYNTEIMNMYYVDLYCKAIKEGKKEEFLSLFKDKEAVVRNDIKEKKNEYLNDLLASVKGGELKAFLELFSEDYLNNLSLEDYDRLIKRLSVKDANDLINYIENEQLKEKIRQDFQNNITDERYIELLIEANTSNNFSTLFEIYDPNFEHLQSFSKEQNQGLISELETTGLNKLLDGINNVNVKENVRQTFEKAITSEQYEEVLINSLKSNDFKTFFKIFDSNCDNLINVRFKYQSLLVSNKTEVDKFLSYVKSINISSYYFLNNNFNKAQNVLNYVNQNSNNETLKEYKDNYIYLDLSLDELKEYEYFYNYAKSMKFVNKEISFDDIINQITSEGNGKLVFQVLADNNFNKLYDNYNEKYQAAIAVTEYINSYCESYGIEDTSVISDYDMKQIIKFVSTAYNNYIEENMSKTVIDSNTQVVSIVGDNERSGEFVVRDLIDVLDYIKQNKNKRSFFTFDSDADCEQLKTDFLNKLISLSKQNPNQRILINIHAHGYPGGFVVGDVVRVTTEELTDTLIQMHNNGVNLSNVTIAFNSCNTFFSSTEIFNRLKEANIENLPVIYAEAGFETKLGFSKGSIYGEETYLYTTLLSNLKTNNSKKVIVSDLYNVQPGITWANPTLFVQIDNDTFDKLDKQLFAVISKYSTNTVDVSDTDKNIDDLENQEDLSPEDIEFLTGDSNYSNTAFPTNIFAYSIFNKEQNAELNEKASIWEEIVFRAVPGMVAAIYDKEGGQENFSAYQESFVYAHALSRWIINDGNVREEMSFSELVDATRQEMSKGTEVLAGIYEDAIKSAQNMSSGEAKEAIIDATLRAIGLHEAYNKGFVSREEFEKGQYDDNIIRQMLINMGVTYELVENLINQSLFLLGYSNENVKQKMFDMSVVYNALSNYNIIGEQDRNRNEIKFNNLIERVFGIIDSIEKINNSDSKNRAKSMTEAEKKLTDTFTPEELEIIDLLASTMFDSIKYVNATRTTSAVEFVNIIYALRDGKALETGLFNENLFPKNGQDLKQHILNMLKHYVEVGKVNRQKKGEESILSKAVNDNENILEEIATFLTDIIVKNNLIEKSKQLREQRKQNMSKFIDGIRKDDTAYSVVMVCSANENRSAIWHIMFEDFLKRTKRKMAKVLSAGVFYDISQDELKEKGKTKDLRDDYIKTLSSDERYKGIDESIKSAFRSRYVEYLRLPKGRQNVFIVAGEQHRAQLIKLGYDPNWIFLMTEFYSDDFKTSFKQTHESLGKELEENNILSMSEFPDPFEEQISRQDLPEFVRSLVDYVFKTRDDIIRETLPAKFAKFTDDYNQFEHMDELPSFAFTDDERREATRELYEDEVSDMVREKYQFEFASNTKYLYVLQNRNNKDALLDVVSREDAELKFKLLALMYLVRIRRGLTKEEMNVMAVARDKIITEFKKQLENNTFKVLNNFDLRSYMMGIYLLLQDDSLNKPVPEIIYDAFIINTDGVVLANSDGYFAAVDLFTIVHELTHVVVSKPGFYSKLVADTVDELVSYVTPNIFLAMINLSLKAYSKMKTGYTMHQTKGVIDYVKMGKKLHVLYNLFSDKTIDRDLRQEEHSAPIAFLELLFNAHTKVGKMVDWVVLFEAIKTIDDENLDQASMFADVLDTYTKMLVAKDKLTKQEADNLIKEIEKMQLWTLLTYDIVQNIKFSDSETYAKILGNKSAISFEEQILVKPAETKEQLKKIADAIKSKEQLSRNDILTLLIIDVISIVDYEQLINNFEGIIEGIINTTRITAQTFNMQKGTYSLSEYEQISKYVTNNYTVTQNSNISIVGNIFNFIASSLDQLFFAKLLINQVFGTKNLNSIMKDKKLLIVTSKQQEETLQQVLKNNNIEDIEIVTIEIRTEPVTNIRSDMVLDVQRGIKARYDNKENKLIVYSKQGINITTEEIQSLIMQEYFSERNEDIVTEDVIAFASATDATLDDITNRLKTAYTASVTMANKETKFDLSLRKIANFIATCNQEFKSTGIKTFVIIDKQTKQFASEIKSLQEQGFRFIISCKSDNVVDITEYDGLLIDATEIRNLNQAINFMKSIKKKVLTQGVAKQISIKFNDNIYEQFEHLGIDIFNNFGIMPVMNADKIRKIGRYEVEKVTENNIEQLLRSNNVAGLVIDNARVFVGKKSIIKQIFSKEHKYNKGYNASLSSKFDYICYDVPVLADLLNIDINNGKDLNKLRNIDLSKLNLSSDSLTYLEYLQKKGNYEEMTGFIRGIAMNTARTQIINALKEKGIELDIEQFAKEANGKYQKAFLTVAVQLMMEGIDITTLLETGYIDSNMTTKQYLDSVFEKVNINIEDVLKQNEYKIERTQNTAKTIEDFKNYVVLLDNLRIIKEATANFDMSMKAVRNMLAAA